MSLTNKHGDMTPFDLGQEPARQNLLLLPLIWGASFVATRKNDLKIQKVNMEGLKPPYLVLSTHQGFSDYYIAPLAVFPHRGNYVSDMEGFATFGKKLYRGIGCIGKRRYVSDVSVVRNILHVLHENKDILTLFPESRHSNVGTTARIPENMGKLCKLLQVPVVMLSVHGSYLANPFWDEEHSRKVPIQATLECICSMEELQEYTAEKLQMMVEEKLTYDEYAWQRDNKIRITGDKLAEGLHKALYQCRECKAEHSMTTSGNTLRCEACGATWNYNEYGELEALMDGEHIHIPDWYEWQREHMIQEIDAGQYAVRYEVTVEALPNEKGFVPLGKAMLTHDADGFSLKLLQQVGGKYTSEIYFQSKNLESLQTEYNYRGRGACIVLSKPDCCFYIYSEDKTFNPTRLQFATEYFNTKYFSKCGGGIQSQI